MTSAPAHLRILALCDEVDDRVHLITTLLWYSNALHTVCV